MHYSMPHRKNPMNSGQRRGSPVFRVQKINHTKRNGHSTVWSN